MVAIFCENCSLSYFQHGQASHHSEASGALLLIMLGKVMLNLFLLQVRKPNLRESYMGYFCNSLAFVDFVLLATMSFIACFQDFMLLGVRFTVYHICLLAQIAALAYGILYYPVSFVAGLDYYLTITQTSKRPNMCWRSLYTVAVAFTWISVLSYVLNLAGSSIGLEVSHSNSAYQCPFYTSSQSYWLTVGMLIIICLVLVFCWSEVVDMVKSIKLISIEREVVLFFPYMPECSLRDSAKHFLTRLIICFIGTWAPFVLLQMLILFLGAEIPACVEMNVPWLYFANSFIIGITFWVRRHQIEMTEETWDVDPFVNWKFCFAPFNWQDEEKTQKPTTQSLIC
ncbi:probable G-protein coupled receptor 160 [Lacerta agilis]|uniref:probable G-protein coupled receptor 160 n=1 Tax=Lacerta agilis TaxID=80427 RepID=UPI00141A585C|nr:probable G-protein coupled receptor 160 [Lacerta agilis]